MLPKWPIIYKSRVLFQKVPSSFDIFFTAGLDLPGGRVRPATDRRPLQRAPQRLPRERSRLLPRVHAKQIKEQISQGQQGNLRSTASEIFTGKERNKGISRHFFFLSCLIFTGIKSGKNKTG